MTATLIDFYINVVALSVRVISQVILVALSFPHNNTTEKLHLIDKDWRQVQQIL